MDFIARERPVRIDKRMPGELAVAVHEQGLKPVRLKVREGRAKLLGPEIAGRLGDAHRCDQSTETRP